MIKEFKEFIMCGNARHGSRGYFGGALKSIVDSLTKT